MTWVSIWVRACSSVVPCSSSGGEELLDRAELVLLGEAVSSASTSSSLTVRPRVSASCASSSVSTRLSAVCSLRASSSGASPPVCACAVACWNCAS